MRLATKLGFLLLFVPLVASAQFRDLDTAMSNLNKGFGGGDVSSIVSGIGSGEQVFLEFPGLVPQKGPFGRDQASLLLDSLFNKAKPSNFEPVSTRKNSADGLYNITAKWTVNSGGTQEVRDLYVTLRANKNNGWSIASVRSAGR
ncbi:MAG TPA: hypothetical protein VLU46_03900 [Thermoanaerobaculia bacterium]|nr:hypothetical protein [Thermoanaerobaculia bacterium]